MDPRHPRVIFKIKFREKSFNPFTNQKTISSSLFIIFSLVLSTVSSTVIVLYYLVVYIKGKIKKNLSIMNTIYFDKLNVWGYGGSASFT